ncbi:hypothetical protein WICPIJ_006153 [Wickerhamomyces pijperi]|uniref:Uncharacterized protein n=1 Tax=Wickerhamomyces pijperi TaxID=599730 RepID=A0A9P8Q2K5_WICPI|nr:hypothetical protein WICPIJ_006153 [Wickerhamomyces pijperi]
MNREPLVTGLTSLTKEESSISVNVTLLPDGVFLCFFGSKVWNEAAESNCFSSNSEEVPANPPTAAAPTPAPKMAVAVVSKEAIGVAVPVLESCVAIVGEVTSLACEPGTTSDSNGSVSAVPTGIKVGAVVGVEISLLPSIAEVVAVCGGVGSVDSAGPVVEVDGSGIEIAATVGVATDLEIAEPVAPTAEPEAAIPSTAAPAAKPVAAPARTPAPEILPGAFLTGEAPFEVFLGCC